MSAGLTRRAVLLGTALAAATAAGRALAHDMGRMAAPAADTPPVATDQVAIDNFTFKPAVIRVKVGTTVTWTNRDDIPHLVTASAAGGFKSPPLDTGDSFTFTFTKPGDYGYFCALHPKMTGRVKVG